MAVLYNALWCESVTRNCDESDADSIQGTGARADTFTNYGHGALRVKKNKKQESDETVLTTQKRLPKRLIVLVKPKSGGARQKFFPALRT